MDGVPDILKSLIRRLSQKMPKREATQAAIKHLQRSGVLLPGTIKLSDRGKVREGLTSEQRAADRTPKSSLAKPHRPRHTAVTSKAKYKK